MQNFTPIGATVAEIICNLTQEKTTTCNRYSLPYFATLRLCSSHPADTEQVSLVFLI